MQVCSAVCSARMKVYTAGRKHYARVSRQAWQQAQAWGRRRTKGQRAGPSAGERQAVCRCTGMAVREAGAKVRVAAPYAVQCRKRGKGWGRVRTNEPRHGGIQAGIEPRRGGRQAACVCGGEAVNLQTQCSSSRGGTKYSEVGGENQEKVFIIACAGVPAETSNLQQAYRYGDRQGRQERRSIVHTRWWRSSVHRNRRWQQCERAGTVARQCAITAGRQAGSANEPVPTERGSRT